MKISRIVRELNPQAGARPSSGAATSNVSSRRVFLKAVVGFASLRPGTAALLYGPAGILVKIILLVLILCCFALYGQPATTISVPTDTLSAPNPFVTIDLWPEGKMPGHGANEPESEVPSKGDGIQRITNVSRPTLSVFPAPKKDNGPATAMIVCPGGGYSYVTYNKEGTEIATWLNSNGTSAVILKYRVPHNRDGALQDVQRALSLARAHAAEWNIDPKRLGVIGFSAGGNLAAKASTLFGERSYPAIDAIDQQSRRPDFAVLVYPAYLDDKNGHVAPDLNLKANIPPTLIVHSEDDKTFVPGSKLYNAALDESKVPHEFLLYPTGGHGYALHCTKDAKAWPDAALNWLHRNHFQ